MTTIKLTPTQETVLQAAAERPDGSLYPLPSNLKGGAALKVITALEQKGLIVDAAINPPYATWMISDEGYRAIGKEPPKAEASEEKTDASFEQDVTEAEQTLGIAPVADKPKTATKLRQGTKQATVIEMLQRPEGATIEEIAQKTGWLSHTIRGFFAGTLKKKLGLDLTRNKTQTTDSDQVSSTTTYRLAG